MEHKCYNPDDRNLNMQLVMNAKDGAQRQELQVMVNKISETCQKTPSSGKGKT
jgi:hypothetical protein